ncbi:DNA protecting protein DprA [Homoserinimonas aerilata]|uniref:DNA protecting protein DprA n=1 Tax=Homoserinimonas aerilata TaxID=1162970 RepID=A0A542YHP0_9MICO|nr:DNA-processing protein DprA [Homoserinimonas aerilata]TQL47617.1 DNA protecting protein DprA [Homoserinimonas aerilata]
MTMFGLKEASVAPLVRQIAGDELSTAEVAEHFARASWSGIAEPGDRVAGVLVGIAGAGAALTALVERWDADRLVAFVADNGGELSSEDARKALARWLPRLTSQTALVALRQAGRLGVRLLTPSHELWPAGLDDLGWHSPLALWVRGGEATLATLDRSIALVGARAATGYGEHVAMEAAAGLVDRGYTIVSGAAYGIDGMAHRSALASGGHTLAFLAGGVDRFYPSGHEALLTRIVESGAVVSELPCGAQPSKWRFLQRNRLIAAASRATVVLEAGWRSGSLNTAGHAAALGRPLGAVPGPVTSAASAGCHRLIREFDAVCVTNAEQMAELAPFDDKHETPDASGPASTDADEHRPEQLRVLDALSTRAPRSPHDVAARSGLSVGDVQSALGILQLDGRVVERERGWIMR